MDNLSCALLKYEVPSQPGTLGLKGILFGEVVNICKHCMDLREGELFCHPIIVRGNPEIPTPFLVLVDEPLIK